MYLGAEAPGTGAPRQKETTYLPVSRLSKCPLYQSYLRHMYIQSHVGSPWRTRVTHLFLTLSTNIWMFPAPLLDLVIVLTPAITRRWLGSLTFQRKTMSPLSWQISGLPASLVSRNWMRFPLPDPWPVLPFCCFAHLFLMGPRKISFFCCFLHLSWRFSW